MKYKLAFFLCMFKWKKQTNKPRKKNEVSKASLKLINTLLHNTQVHAYTTKTFLTGLLSQPLHMNYAGQCAYKLRLQHTKLVYLYFFLCTYTCVRICVSTCHIKGVLNWSVILIFILNKSLFEFLKKFDFSFSQDKFRIKN